MLRVSRRCDSLAVCFGPEKQTRMRLEDLSDLWHENLEVA